MNPELPVKSLRLVIFLLFAFLLAACNFSLAADITPPPGYQSRPEVQATTTETSGLVYPLLPSDPDNGEAIFAEKCARCHGATGKGDGPAIAQLPDPVPAIGDVTLTRYATPAGWFQVITQGKPEFMPSFAEELTDQERWDVAAYTFLLNTSLSGTAQSAELYNANCVRCHGVQGKGDGPDVSGGSVEIPDFTEPQYMANRSAADLFQVITNGAGPMMTAYAEQFSQEQRWALAEYLRWISFVPVESAAGATPAVQGTPGVQVKPTSEVSATVETQWMGVIAGSVTHGSGGQVPEGLEVMLRGVDGMQIVLTATTTLRADGAYVFQDIPMPEARVFLVTVEFDGVTYGSEIAEVKAGDTKFDLPIQVYATTTDPSVLRIDRLHFFLERLDANTLRVVELYIISNPGSKTLAPSAEGQPVLSFHLPPNATNLEFDEGALGERFVQTADGFADTWPVYPGSEQYQMVFAYEMPYVGKLELTHPFNLATGAIVILIPEDGIRVKGDTIQDDGVRDVQGMAYHMYSGSSMQAGQELRMTISNSQSPLSLFGSSSTLWVGLLVLGIVLLLAAARLYSWIQPVKREMPVGEAFVDLPVFAESEESIMDAILALDDLYQEGQLPEEAYQQRRAELKGKLKKIREPGSGGAGEPRG